MWFPHFRHGQRMVNMNRYMNAKLADIPFIYGLANGNGRVVVRLSRPVGDKYQTRRQSNHKTFARLNLNLAELGPFRATIDDTPINSKVDLMAGTTNTAATIRETSNMSANPCHFGVVQGLKLDCKLRLVGRNRDNISRFEDDAPDEESDPTNVVI
ncbi:hypothetical protein TNCV_376941 [Trichonephila clavipes]|nr:hypothetical protein TNCV_376941 [Trichonephila clavipes]